MTPSSFTIAFIAGVTLTRWTSAWETRQRSIPLAFIATDVDTQVSALHDGSADVSFVRLPVDGSGLSVIPLYSESAVVVVPKDHPLADLDTVSLADLESEDRVDEALFPADAVELVAVGGGVVILPQSIARMHGRKDVVARLVTDAPETRIAIAWLTENESPEIDEFVGIVRGRTARSSRAGNQPDESKVDRIAREQKAAKAKLPQKKKTVAPKRFPKPRRPRGGR